MNIKNKKNTFNKIESSLSLKDMIGRYTSIVPINCVDLKHKMK